MVGEVGDVAADTQGFGGFGGGGECAGGVAHADGIGNHKVFRDIENALNLFFDRLRADGTQYVEANAE